MPAVNKYQQIGQIVRGLDIYVATGKTSKKLPTRYAIIKGNGQDVIEGDDTFFWRENLIQLEYYYTKKNEAQETEFEDALLDAGFLFEKSEDVFIEEEGVFIIYYDIN